MREGQSWAFQELASIKGLGIAGSGTKRKGKGGSVSKIDQM
jgi:hypothetical protein